MNCRISVRDRNALCLWESDDWTAVVTLAALSAEPETVGELAAAMRRYLPNHRLIEDARQMTDVGTAEDQEGPWCLIDLAGLTVVAGGGFELPDPNTAYQVNEDEQDQVDGFPVVWLDTPSGWLFQTSDGDWRQTVSVRAKATAAEPRVCHREVLFDRPLLEFVAEQVQSDVTEATAAHDRETTRTRDIHAAWLMTARADLRGRTPRQVLLADRKRIDLDLQHRAQQWSRQGDAPPALSDSSFACRFGGYGTAQIVLYFDLVRTLLAEAWQVMRREPGMDHNVLVQRLADHRDEWLASPHEGEGDLTAGDLIDAERRRMPVTSDGAHGDCDCPICQAEAAGNFGPTFAWFDGHHLELEDEFAFSLIESREEWELEYGASDELAETIPVETADRKVPGAEDDLNESAWRTSYVDWDSVIRPGAPRGLAELAIGFRLAELVGDLKQREGGQSHLESLNAAYTSFRIAQSDIVARSAAEQLRQRLEAVDTTFPDLVAKSADLQSCLDEVLRRVTNRADV